MAQEATELTTIKAYTLASLCNEVDEKGWIYDVEERTRTTAVIHVYDNHGVYQFTM